MHLKATKDAEGSETGCTQMSKDLHNRDKVVEARDRNLAGLHFLSQQRTPEFQRLLSSTQVRSQGNSRSSNASQAIQRPAKFRHNAGKSPKAPVKVLTTGACSTNYTREPTRTLTRSPTYMYIRPPTHIQPLTFVLKHNRDIVA